MEAVEEGRVALVSALPPAQPFTTQGALSRNTLLWALSRLVCVIGPKDTGGSVHTARQALAQKRPLFIWCEDVHRDVSESLKRMGAEPLDELDGEIRLEALRQAWNAEANIRLLKPL